MGSRVDGEICRGAELEWEKEAEKDSQFATVEVTVINCRKD